MATTDLGTAQSHISEDPLYAEYFAERPEDSESSPVELVYDDDISLNRVESGAVAVEAMGLGATGTVTKASGEASDTDVDCSTVLGTETVTRVEGERSDADENWMTTAR
jgi:hypothetical protein